MKYETETRNMSGSDYLKVDIENNSPESLFNVKTLLNTIPCVRRCNITTAGKRDNLTVYPIKFTSIEKLEEEVRKELNKY